MDTLRPLSEGRAQMTEMNAKLGAGEATMTATTTGTTTGTMTGTMTTPNEEGTADDGTTDIGRATDARTTREAKKDDTTKRDTKIRDGKEAAAKNASKRNADTKSADAKKRRKKPPRGTQLTLARTAGHGGKRAGAGRKPKQGRRNVAHLLRPRLRARTPVHVTLRLLRGRPSLRAQVIRRMFETIVRQTCRDEFHVAAFSLQHDHAHLICEATDKATLSSGLRSVIIRFALRMNKLFDRTVGKNWGDRYHRHDLRTPREVRNALVYVLRNAVKHQVLGADDGPDPFASAAGFDEATPCAAPRSWLLGIGWKKADGKEGIDVAGP